MNTKKVQLNLVGLDGNAFVLLAKFSKAAKQQNFTNDFITNVLNEATEGDYNHLLRTLLKYTELPKDDWNETEGFNNSVLL